MDLRQLAYFVTLAEELHFGRAAERLRMTQPPLSQQIRRLEEEIGVELFHRTRRQVRLTAAGGLFLAEARRLLEDARNAVEIARRADQGELGRLAVGFVGSAAHDILPRTVREFRSRYPGVNLEMVELSTPMQVEALRDGRIDVGLLRPPVEEAFLQVRTLYESPCLLAVHRSHPLSAGPRAGFRDLKSEPFVALSRKTWGWFYDEVLKACRSCGFHPRVRQEALEFQTVVGLVAAGMGVAVVPRSVRCLQPEGVVYLPLTEPAPKAAMAICWRKDGQAPQTERFVEVAARAGESLGLDEEWVGCGVSSS